ncbi:Mitochondrial escape protein 2 [Wickerhamomyces ciferrii]|uniref:Mitochondrial escape protein 2 n=1 Tax=Wickerhamomyces ciferrii (strain ATCC 14091 / BCRC 22168 / CBS 111 / JCM 3599 / NBRC 0793 / NRRL Y-1031 F-60-10) TaxID=1206466 RepID=K0KLM8_WICCF|nr:Mitochondrial escape protein 2 [Wickerhamomyces ciferrii]CCH43886.1 Mitochondrial escape protein 2 [Wickerhamomyces ciferrii]
MLLRNLGLRRVNPFINTAKRLGAIPKPSINLNRSYATDDTIQKRDIEAGESVDANETGVIEKDDQETMLYFDHVLPFRSSIWDIRQWLSYLIVSDKRPEAIKEHVLALANPKREGDTVSIPGLEVTKLVPIKRDGGAFVKFKVPDGFTVSELNAKIQKNTIEESNNGVLNIISQSAAFPVKGVPWIEDLRRYPNRTIKVKFSGPALSEEELYSLFRRYGTIVDIKPATEEDKKATVIFRSFRGAICSKNCITGMKIDDTTLHIQYERYNSKNVILDWIMNHTRIAIPLFLALFAGLAVVIFDPIREFSIENKITHNFIFNKKNSVIRFVNDLTSSTISSFQKFIGQDAKGGARRGLWSERLDLVKELKLWIEENVNTFIIVRGPRGTGKHELVMQHALHGRDNILYIDCDKLVKSRSDSQFISNAAHEVGYFPVFPWLNSFSNIIDLGVQGLTGQKSGFSESKDTQFRNILSSVMIAIRKISLTGYKAVVGSGENSTPVKEEDFLQQHPEKKPVIIIDRFSTTNRSESNAFVYKELADWTAMLISMNLAHVVFLTEDVGTSQFLSESLPDQVFKSIALSDASHESAKSYVIDQLHEDNTLTDDESGSEDEKKPDLSQNPSVVKDLDEALGPIGGRMLDLQAFVRRAKSGETPLEALNRMVTQTAEQITQIFLSRDAGMKNARAWELMKLLADHETLEYKQLVYNPLFKSNPEAALIELERNGLITVSRDRGIMRTIGPAKPIFRAAFQNLVKDESLSKVLETSYLLKIISSETEKIQKFEDEVQKLSYFATDRAFRGRLSYLADKIDASNQNILNAEESIKKFSK